MRAEEQLYILRDMNNEGPANRASIIQKSLLKETSLHHC